MYTRHFQTIFCFISWCSTSIRFVDFWRVQVTSLLQILLQTAVFTGGVEQPDGTPYNICMSLAVPFTHIIKQCMCYVIEIGKCRCNILSIKMMIFFFCKVSSKSLTLCHLNLFV